MKFVVFTLLMLVFICSFTSEAGTYVFRLHVLFYVYYIVFYSVIYN